MLGFYAYAPNYSAPKLENPWDFQDSQLSLNYEGAHTWNIRDYLIVEIGNHFQSLSTLKAQTLNAQLVEQILDNILESGPESVRMFDGDFLFLVYNKTSHELLVINNRSQAHKLYYSDSKSALYFGTHMNHFKKMKLSIEVDLGSVRGFVGNGFTMSDQTQIKSVKKLLPAFSIAATSSGAELREYWNKDFRFEKKAFGNVDHALDQYESLYQKGVESFIDSYQTKNLGTLLSGGHDSSFTLIQASQVFNKPLQAFTCTFPNWVFNEESYAEHLSDRFGARFHPVAFESHHLDQVIGLINDCQEPVVGSCLPLYVLGKEAKNHVDTLLGGDGGDTLWAEYYPVQEYHRFIKNLPLGARKLIHNITKSIRDITDWERFWELEHVSSLFTSEDYYDGFMRKLCTYRHFPDELQNQVFSSEVLSYQIPKSVLEIPFTKKNFSRSLIEGKLYNAFFTYQSFSQYRTLESSGLNVFFPTLSKPVMDFICSLPWKWVNGGTSLHRLTNNKVINRRFHKIALSRHLYQDEIYNRSFDMPWHSILKPRKHVLEKLLSALDKRGWFQSDQLRALFKEFQSQHVKEHELLELKHHGYRIYTLLVLEVWTRLYIDTISGFDEKTNLEDFLS